MGLICLVMGLIIGKQLTEAKTASTYRKNKNRQINHKHYNQSNNRKTFTIKKRMKKFFILNKSTPEPVNLDQISIKIEKNRPARNKASPEPDPKVLAVLWSHFKACSLGLLNKDQPAPWENIETDQTNLGNKETPDEHSRWIKFLKNLISNKSLAKLIKNPDDLKFTAITAYHSI